MESAQALVVIDVQEAIFDLPIPLFGPDQFVGNVRKLLAKARAAKVPVFLIQHCGPTGGRFEKNTAGWQLHACLERNNEDIVIEKSQPGACHGSNLESRLAELGIKRVAVCGFASPFCVDTTVRNLYSAGFDVQLAADAHTTTDGEILTAKETIDHHNWVLKRFSSVIPNNEIDFL